MTNIIRGVEHIGVTVPDIDQAAEFFQEAFGAKVSYDNTTPEQTPLGGPEVEITLGLTKGAKATHQRMLVIGDSTTIELFKYVDTEQRQPLDAPDYGLQHVAFYVDDIDQAADLFVKAGGTLNTQPKELLGHLEGGEGNKFLYGRTPWGMLVELIQYPSGINYPENSETPRWTPPRREGHVVRGIDHLGVTVADIEQATKFFQEAFGAKISYDNVTPEQTPLEGPETEEILGLRKGAKSTHLRLLVIGESPAIELFKYIDTDQREPLDASDYGLQHMGIYVDDIDRAADLFVKAGGTLNTQPQDILGHREGGEGNKFLYARTPWGTLVELIKYPSGVNYPENSEAPRWTPAKRN